MLHHDRVYKASAVDRKNLEFELRNFLLGHATQIKDNTAFASQVEDAVSKHADLLDIGP